MYAALGVTIGDIEFTEELNIAYGDKSGKSKASFSFTF